MVPDENKFQRSYFHGLCFATIKTILHIIRKHVCCRRM